MASAISIITRSVFWYLMVLKGLEGIPYKELDTQGLPKPQWTMSLVQILHFVLPGHAVPTYATVDYVIPLDSSCCIPSCLERRQILQRRLPVISCLTCCLTLMIVMM